MKGSVGKTVILLCCLGNHLNRDFAKVSINHVDNLRSHALLDGHLN